MTETYLSERGWKLAGHVSEYLMTVKTIPTLKLIQQAFAKASPAERSQVAAFVRANSSRVRKGASWFLATAEHLDTGRKFLTAGYSYESPGITLTQFLPLIKDIPHGQQANSRRATEGADEASQPGADTRDRKGPSTGQRKQELQGLDEVPSSDNKITPTPTRRPLLTGGRLRNKSKES